MKLKFALFLTAFIIISSLSAQRFKEWDHNIGYFGNTLMNPGVEYFVETPLYDTDNNVKLFLPMGRTTASLSGHLISYWDPFSHVGLLNYYEINARQYISQRLGLHVGAGLGSQFNFTTDNYVIDDNFEVSKRCLNADVYIIPEISIGFIYKNSKLTRRYLSKMNLFLLTPYNNGVLPSFSYSLTIKL